MGDLDAIRSHGWGHDHAAAICTIRPSVVAQAMAPSGRMGGLILLDDHEEPLRPAILWTDERAKPLISEWDRSGMTSALFDQSGTALIAGLTLPLWAWMSIHQPEIVSPTRHVLFMKDWIRWKLTGVLATDESEHMWIPGDVRKRALTEEVLDTVGAHGLLERLPPIVDATAVVGSLTHEVSQATSLPKGLPVVSDPGRPFHVDDTRHRAVREARLKRPRGGREADRAVSMLQRGLRGLLGLEGGFA